jgi:purine-nucleoside phosphorylase
VAPEPPAGTQLLPAAAAAVRAHSTLWPEVAVIAGSGLADLAAAMTDAVVVPYAAIPGWPPATVAGHAGELILGRLGGRPVVLARGRAHLYEGYTAAQVTFGVRLFHALGTRTLVVTNAAGGLNPAFRPGDVMVLTDHIFLPGMAGQNPLMGPNDEAVGPRFPVLRGAYDAALAELARVALVEVGLTVHDGVYAMVAGPSFETPAEARLLRAWGVDAVGMSTVPEVVVARHAGMRVLGLSLITNLVPQAQASAGEAVPAEVHAEVLAAGARAAAALGQALARIAAAA